MVIILGIKKKKCMYSTISTISVAAGVGTIVAVILRQLKVFLHFPYLPWDKLQKPVQSVWQLTDLCQNRAPLFWLLYLTCLCLMFLCFTCTLPHLWSLFDPFVFHVSLLSQQCLICVIYLPRRYVCISPSDSVPAFPRLSPIPLSV